MITHIKPAIQCSDHFSIFQTINDGKQTGTPPTHFTLGVSVEGERVRMLGPGRADLEERKRGWVANVGRNVARELREERRVKVFRGQVRWDGEVAGVVLLRAVVVSPKKWAARIQELAETA
ncbi:hypothetical protein GCM10022631_07200 [Deinococcus rubellus]|uniref:hypothetical protein n=1 Tax=Deinococcus rubellus TaxID=1889240 RepID=UPI0031F0935E